MNLEERYASYSNVQLILIVRNPTDYQPIAVETAQKVLDKRSVSDSEELEAVAELAKISFQRMVKDAKDKKLNEDVGDATVEFLVPYATLLPKLIKTSPLFTLIAALLLMALVYMVIFGVAILMNYVNDFPSSVDEFFIASMLVLLLIGFSFVSFILKKRIGWIFTSLFFSLSFVSSVSFLLMPYVFDGESSIKFSFIKNEDSIVEYIWTSLLFLACTLTLCLKPIREEFSIGWQSAMLTISTPLILALLVGGVLLVYLLF